MSRSPSPPRAAADVAARRRAPRPVRQVARGVAGLGRGVGALRRGIGAFWRAARSGERPLAVVLLVAIALAVVMLSGPFQRYVDGRERVRGLERSVAALDAEIDRLELRRDDLRDPANIERLAREQLGFVRPGEVPYTLVPPEVDRPQIATPRDLAVEEPPRSWYARAWDAVTSWLG